MHLFLQFIYLLPGLFEFGTEGDGFLIVFHGCLLHVMLQAFVTHKDVFSGILYKGFPLLHCCSFQCTAFLFQTVDDVQPPSDEALHVALLDVVAVMDGSDSFIKARSYPRLL